MADYTDKPGYAFSPGAPPEARRFLANKGYQPAFSFEDVEPEEHAVAFSVAKATQMDVLTTIREEVQRALDEGVPLRDFQKSLRPRLEKLGWWGKAQMQDPLTGEVIEAQLGSPRRLRTIYRANLRSARAAGQWERIERTKAAMPYLQYNLGPSERHRPHHQAKAGLVLPVDDPFWSYWNPPNGWGCKCWVRQISKREAEDLGVSDPPPVPFREVLNKRTGEVRRVPAGIDPGWDRNPGKLRRQHLEDHLKGKLAAADPLVARVASRDIATSWMAERVLAGGAGTAVPIGVLPPEIAEQLGLKSGVVRVTDTYGEKFIVRGRSVGTETLAELSDALHDGKLAMEEKDGVRSLIVFSRTEKPWRFVLKVMPEADEIWVRTIHRTEPRKWRALLRRATVTVLRE